MKNCHRSYEPELIDLGPSHYSEEEYRECLHQLKRIGRILGGDQATLRTFRKLPTPRTILDVGCGGGHFTLELARQYPAAHVVGVDISPQAIDFAQARLQEAALNNVEFSLAPTETLSYPPNSFDYVTTTLVCHHLNDEALINFLKRAYQVAAKSVILNDLHRHWLAYSSFALIAKPLFRNRLITNDGLLSIKRGFKKQDWIRYLKAAEIPIEDCSITWHWAFRWVVCIHTTSKFKQ
jgi:2-polyprenyl-3-methyl-5-hydroxy-6-metoxy-1,4-benzoquinol methylase